MPLIDAGGTQLFYRFDGPAEAPVLLLSNSLGTTHAMWEPQVAAFAEHFRLLRYDSRGHGRSAVPPGPYTIADLGRDVLALLDELDLYRVHVCGLSKGGMVGQWLALEAPQRVGRLVLCNTAAKVGPPDGWNQRIAAVEAGGMQAIVPALIDRWFTRLFQQAEPATVERIVAQLLSLDPRGYCACLAAVRDMDLLERLPAVAAPTLVVTGRADVALPPALGEEIARRIPGARLQELPAAHLSNLESAALFNAAVLAFLKE